MRSSNVFRVLILAGCAFASIPLLAQQPTTTELQSITLDMAITSPGRFFASPPPGLAWHPDGRVVWVKRIGRELALVASDPAGGPTSTLLEQKSLEKAVVAAGFKNLAGGILRSSTWSADGKSLRFFANGALFRVHLGPVRVERILQIPARAEAVAFAPKDERVAYVEGHDITVVKMDGSRVAVTKDGHSDVHYGVSVSREEFGIHDGMWWDPTGRRMAFYREDLRPIAKYPYADFKPTPARAVHGRYPMAGRAGSKVSVGVYDSRGDAVIWLDTDPSIDEYLTNVTWNADGTSLFVAHVNRAQNSMDLVEYDAGTGKRLRKHFNESDAEWIEPESGPMFLPGDSGRYLWFSWRNGFRHLHLFDAHGKHLRQITTGSFDVSEFKGWDADGLGFFFQTTGPDPRQQHLYYAALNGIQRAVTSGRGFHQTTLSPDRKHVLDVHDSLVLPLAVDVLDASGRKLIRLREARNPLARYAVGRQELFSVENEKGERFYGHLILPPDHKEGQRHPVLQYVYGGPHAQLVQDRWLGGRSRWVCWLHALAARGYVVFRIDGHGTPNRGIEWQQAIHRRLGTLETEDQILGLAHVLGRFGDADRVGVTGWSFGGFMTLSLMTREGKRYAAGVSGAPVTDWSYYETGYGERYMDTPQENEKGYTTADPGNHVKGLKGRLLVVQGTSDDVVMWQNTISFLDKCIKAGVDVDYMVYPGQKHGLGGPYFAHFVRKATRYLDEHVKDALILGKADTPGTGGR